MPNLAVVSIAISPYQVVIVADNGIWIYPPSVNLEPMLMSQYYIKVGLCLSSKVGTGWVNTVTLEDNDPELIDPIPVLTSNSQPDLCRTRDVIEAITVRNYYLKYGQLYRPNTRRDCYLRELSKINQVLAVQGALSRSEVKNVISHQSLEIMIETGILELSDIGYHLP